MELQNIKRNGLQPLAAGPIGPPPASTDPLVSEVGDDSAALR
ncbi:hypothetical protein [Glycomyces salinus]|nr:hypothetical protein [Glycomyces salinus]